jgi:UDP-3-O-[3-hydroxymyristoyl] N-acetylglucosamine deacetylase
MAAVTIAKQYEQNFPGNKCLFTYEGLGTTSKQNIKVAVYLTAANSGIYFVLSDSKNGELIRVPALASNVVNTLRNVTIGQGSVRLCLVEHFLAAAAFCNVFNIDVLVDGPELPLGDGSALLWLDLFSKAGYEPVLPENKIALSESICVSKGDRQLIAIPAAEFSINYLMDWSHPAIGKRWCSWSPKQSPSEIACARTFGSQKEHDLLGIGNEAVSLTETGFNKSLHYEDEPVRHKLLDLLGDLVLVGLNPLSINAQFISIKGGHEMDVELAKQLKDKLQK